jgi:hypothetical protein
MFKSLLRDRTLWILLLLAAGIKIYSLDEPLVESSYTYGIYPYISVALRWLFGWIPFSIGDVAYLLAFVFLVLKTWKLLRLLASRQLKMYLSWILLRKYLRLVLWIYIVFNVFWGLNYNRVGIAGQLQIEVQPYSAQDVYALATALQQQLNHYAAQVSDSGRKNLQNHQELFREGINAYSVVEQSYPFLKYQQPSIKPSIFSGIGAYFGFTGYYNPFTGEAQLKTSVPVFVRPFIVCHEMAHQVGYAKENEANMVAFLTGRVSSNVEFRYSAYWDVYTYAIRELKRYDTTAFKQLRESVHPQFKKDYEAYLMYLYENENVVEPLMSDFYDRYLKLNNQPKGKATYNEVVAWLIAYMKRYGEVSPLSPGGGN